MSTSKLSNILSAISKLSVESNVLQFLKDKVKIATTTSTGIVRPDNKTTVLTPTRDVSLSHYTTPNTADKLLNFEGVDSTKMMLSVHGTVSTTAIVLSEASVTFVKVDNKPYLKFMAVSFLQPAQIINTYLIVIPELGIVDTTKITVPDGLLDLSSYSIIPANLTVTVTAVDSLGNKGASSITTLTTN